MIVYVDRRNGLVTGTYAWPQRDGQESIDASSADVQNYYASQPSLDGTDPLKDINNKIFELQSTVANLQTTVATLQAQPAKPA